MSTSLLLYRERTKGKYLVLSLLIFLSYTAFSQDSTRVVKKDPASSRIVILDTAFLIPQLDRVTRVRIYFPVGYNIHNKRYPVIYMYGGQNIFNDNTADSTKWNVDGCLDSLGRKGRASCIIVAVDDNDRPRTETPQVDPVQTPNDGLDKYVDFIAETLKPFIDNQYRTLPAKENTIIAGSATGGLLACYGMLMYPGIFGKAGIFSPAFLTGSAMRQRTDSLIGKATGKFFFYIGEEGEAADVLAMNDLTDKLGGNSNTMIYLVVDEKNNVMAWRKWFAEFYNWIMADGFNNVIRMEK